MIPDFVEHTNPLPNLLEKNIFFELQKTQLDAIENLKTLVNISLLSKSFRYKITYPFKNRCQFSGITAFLEQTE